MVDAREMKTETDEAASQNATNEIKENNKYGRKLSAWQFVVGSEQEEAADSECCGYHFILSCQLHNSIGQRTHRYPTPTPYPHTQCSQSTVKEPSHEKKPDYSVMEFDSVKDRCPWRREGVRFVFGLASQLCPPSLPPSLPPSYVKSALSQNKGVRWQAGYWVIGGQQL